VSGDSDFSPLVAKLKENGKRVLGLAMRNSTSDLLVSACDEFIFYEDLVAEDVPQTVELENVVPGERRKVFRLLLETLTALQREVSGPILASMIKDTIRRKQPSFSESGYGYRSFSALLEDAQTAGLLRLSRDARSGTYTVIEFQSPAPRTVRRRRRTTRNDTSVSKASSTTTTTSTSSSRSPRKTTRTSRTGTRRSTRKSTASSGEGSSGQSRKSSSRRRRARSHVRVAPGV